MYRVILVCMAGMSTNVMRQKIEDAAKAENISMTVKAIGMDELRDNLEDTSLVLLGPQIKYNEDNIRKEIDKVDPSIPMLVIDPSDFGMMRGDKVLVSVMKVLEKK